MKCVPAQDGFYEQSVLISLGSHTALHFWSQPRDESELLMYKEQHGSSSGTQVYKEALGRPSDMMLWLEPGVQLLVLLLLPLFGSLPYLMLDS